MAEIVGGFLVPHAPMYLTLNDVVQTEKKKECDAAFAQTVERLKDLDADTVIVIGDDHYTIFGPDCIPSALIGIGDVDGPFEKWMGAEFSQIPTNEPLANHIMKFGHQSREHRVDWAVSKALTVDHGIFVPWQYGIKPVDGLKTIPVYINSGVEPLINSQRCYEIGQSIAAAVESWDGAGRVAVFGTGGGAHWPALGEWDELNKDWDLEILKYVEDGDVEKLIAMSDGHIREVGGNGGWEIKNWICMMGVVGDKARGETYCYQDAHELFGAFAYLQMKIAA